MNIRTRWWTFTAIFASAVMLADRQCGLADPCLQTGATPETAKVISELLKQAAVAVNEIDDPEKKAVAFMALATVQARAGDRPAAQHSIQESMTAIRALGDISGSERAFLPANVAICQAEIDDLPGALQTIKSIPEANVRGFARVFVIDTLLTRGAHQQALEVSRGIENADVRERRLSSVAECKSRNGDLQAALSIVKELEKSKNHEVALVLVALARLEAGDIESAQRLASTIENSLPKFRVLCEIANAQLEAKQDDAARHTFREAQQLANTAKLTKPLVHLVVLQAKLGDLQGAMAVVDTLDDPAIRIGIAKQVILWLAEKEQIAQAVSLVSRIRDDPHKDDTLRELAVFQAKAGEIKAGLDAARSLQQAYARSYAFREIAKVQFEKGNRDGAKASLAEALKATVNFPVGGGTNVILVQEVAAAQAETGDAEAARQTFLLALTTTESYPDLSYRGQLAGNIAKAEAAAGLADAAAQWALKLPSPEMRVPALLGVVDGLLAMARDRGK